MKKIYMFLTVALITIFLVVIVYGQNKEGIALSSTFRETIKNSSKEVEKETVEKDEQNQAVEGLDFIVATDIHYLADSLTDDGVAFQTYATSGDGRQLIYSEELVEAFKYNVIKKQPEVLIISGDITNNGEKASHEEMAKKLKEIEEAGTEVLVIPGNHDINNPWARGFEEEKQVVVESVTAEDFEKIYADFGYNEAVSRDKDSLSYLAKANDDVWVLMLDTSMYENNTTHPVTNGRIKSSTLEWIRSCSELAKENGVQIVTAMHHNLYDHSELLNAGFTLDNNTEVFDTLLESNFNFVLSGHIHIQDIKLNLEKDIYDIVTNALLVYPHQYGKITYNKENGFVYTTEKVDVELWAKENGIKDINLLNFSTYSRKYFYDRSYQQTYKNLVEKEEFTVEQAKSMASVMAELNVNYFGGTTFSVAEKVKASEGYKLWDTEADAFFKYYVLSMVESKEDYNFVEIPNQVRE